MEGAPARWRRSASKERRTCSRLLAGSGSRSRRRRTRETAAESEARAASGSFTQFEAGRSRDERTWRAHALAVGELITINIDVPTAVTTVIGKLPQLRSFKDAMAEALPKFELANLEQLETYTLATAHAHAIYLSSSAPPEAIVKLTADATALRDLLYSDAVALANRGLVSGARLGEFKGAVGYKNVAFDLLGLTALLREAWAQVAGKTAVTLADLDNADVIGEQLVNAVGTRDQSAAPADAIQIRQRLFTLFVTAWDQVRRAISYLRWNEDDVDDIIPSLYAGRARRKTDVPPEPPTPPVAEDGAATKTSTGAATPAASASAAFGGNGAKPVTTGGTTGTPGSAPFAP